jgi:hypothetical protein
MSSFTAEVYNPAIARAQEEGVSMESLFQIVTMDTVTGRLREIG